PRPCGSPRDDDADRRSADRARAPLPSACSTIARSSRTRPPATSRRFLPVRPAYRLMSTISTAETASLPVPLAQPADAPLVVWTQLEHHRRQRGGEIANGQPG